jgi:hypothetical protein
MRWPVLPGANGRCSVVSAMGARRRCSGIGGGNHPEAAMGGLATTWAKPTQMATSVNRQFEPRDSAALGVSGLSTVDGEMELGSNVDFETRWWRLQRATWLVMALLLLGGLAGAFGRGPFDKATAGGPEDALRVEYEPVVHFRTPTILTLHMAADAVAGDVVRIRLGHALLGPLEIERIIPRPLEQVATSDGLLMTFDTTHGSREATATIVLQPGTLGPVPVELAAGDRPPIRFHALVLP